MNAFFMELDVKTVISVSPPVAARADEDTGRILVDVHSTVQRDTPVAESLQAPVKMDGDGVSPESPFTLTAEPCQSGTGDS